MSVVEELKSQIDAELVRVRKSAWEWRAQGAAFKQQAKSFNRGADSLLADAAQAAMVRQHSQDPYLLSVALETLMSIV